MKKCKFPLGIDSFEKIRSSGYYYIDKTLLIQTLLANAFEVNLITRPRRFGKTLMMSMLEDFFDISLDSSSDFTGLAITEDAVICREWMNKWPVVFLTLESVEGTDFNSAYGMLTVLIADLCKKYAFLLNSPSVNPEDRKVFHMLMARGADEAEVKNSLYTIMRMMHAHYGKPAILLIDEYDVPLACASEAGYYPEMLDVIRALLGKALKSNEHLKFSVVTGCLKIAKESIFTGTNNFVSDTITGDRFDEYLGFTETDVKRLLSDIGMEDHSEEMKKWYDGYLFGSVNVYCPWDVLNHAAALQLNKNKRPQNYWASTSHNGILYRFISRQDIDVNDKFEILMNGGYITETVTEDLTYDTLKSSEENLWSLLYLTGYLTRAAHTETKYRSDENQIALCIPNEEVKAIFKTAIIEWFNESVRKSDRSELFNALWNGQTEIVTEKISDLLFTTISYHDYQESYYHAFLTGLFAGAGYIVESNYEYGTGRPDIVVRDKENRRALIIETKHVAREDALPKGCSDALRQIRERGYAAGLGSGYRHILCYGIAFYKKECLVEKG